MRGGDTVAKQDEVVSKTVMLEKNQIAAIDRICAARKLRSDSIVVRELIDASLPAALKQAGVKG